MLDVQKKNHSYLISKKSVRLLSLKSMASCFKWNRVFITKPQTSHFEQLQVNSQNKNSSKYTIGWAVAS